MPHHSTAYRGSTIYLTYRLWNIIHGSTSALHPGFNFLRIPVARLEMCWHMILRVADMKKAPAKPTGSKSKHKAGITDSYNRYKMYGEKQYTGMAVGRSHKWYYDQGIWLDKKITPEKWLISYEVTKRRAGKAPKGSGVPVGTEYHWYILAHQMVKKLDANSYSTALNGLKYKLAHKRSDKGKWNISNRTQRNHLVKILKSFIEELESEPIEEFVEESGNMIKPSKVATKSTLKVTKPIKKARRKPEPEPA